MNKVIKYFKNLKSTLQYRFLSDKTYKKMFSENMTVSQAENIVKEIIGLDESLQLIGKDLYAENKGMHGKLHYELRPGISLAKKLKANKVTLIKKESLQFDILLSWDEKEGKEVRKKVECVTAMEHYEDALRLEHLKKYHFTPAFHDIDFEGAKENRTIKESEPFQTFFKDDIKEKIVKKLAPEIKQQFQKKLNKQNETVYQDTILLIVIDDWIYHNKEQLQSELNPVVLDIKGTENDFIGIYIIGISGFFVKVK